MKRFTFFLLVYFCFASFIMAQEIDVGTADSDSKSTFESICGGGVKYISELIGGGKGSPTSRPKADFATSDLALEDIISFYVKKLKCDFRECTPPTDTCAVVLEDGFRQKPRLVDPKDKVNWNFRGRVVKAWHCSNCGVLKATPNNEEHHYSFSKIETSSTNLSDARLHKIFPNPSTGLVNLAITTAKEHGEVLIKVFDLSGKMVNQEIYQADPDSKFLAQMDLSALNTGVYLVSTFVDEQLIGTTKVTVEK